MLIANGKITFNALQGQPASQRILKIYLLNYYVTLISILYSFVHFSRNFITFITDLGVVNGNFIHYQKFKTKWRTPRLDPDLPLFKMAADRYREMYGENWKGANFRSEVANTTFEKSGPTVHLASDILL